MSSLSALPDKDTSRTSPREKFNRNFGRLLAIIDDYMNRDTEWRESDDAFHYNDRTTKVWREAEIAFTKALEEYSRVILRDDGADYGPIARLFRVYMRDSEMKQFMFVTDNVESGSLHEVEFSEVEFDTEKTRWAENFATVLGIFSVASKRKWQCLLAPTGEYVSMMSELAGRLLLILADTPSAEIDEASYCLCNILRYAEMEGVEYINSFCGYRNTINLLQPDDVKTRLEAVVQSFHLVRNRRERFSKKATPKDEHFYHVWELCTLEDDLLCGFYRRILRNTYDKKCLICDEETLLLFGRAIVAESEAAFYLDTRKKTWITLEKTISKWMDRSSSTTEGVIRDGEVVGKEAFDSQFFKVMELHKEFKLVVERAFKYVLDTADSSRFAPTLLRAWCDEQLKRLELVIFLHETNKFNPKQTPNFVLKLCVEYVDKIEKKISLCQREFTMESWHWAWAQRVFDYIEPLLVEATKQVCPFTVSKRTTQKKLSDWKVSEWYTALKIRMGLLFQSLLSCGSLADEAVKRKHDDFLLRYETFWAELLKAEEERRAEIQRTEEERAAFKRALEKERKRLLEERKAALVLEEAERRKKHEERKKKHEERKKLEEQEEALRGEESSKLIARTESIRAKQREEKVRKCMEERKKDILLLSAPHVTLLNYDKRGNLVFENKRIVKANNLESQNFRHADIKKAQKKRRKL